MRNILKSDLTLKIASVLIAVGLWFYVVQVQSPDIERTVADIPVIFSQKELLEERGLALLQDQEHTIDLKIRGKRRLVVDINNANVTVIADVSQITAPGSHALYTNVVLPVAGVEITKKTPATLEVEVDELRTKEIDVQYAIVGSPEQDYVLGNVELEPKTIEVKGPKTVVDGISTLQAQVDVSGKNADLSVVADIKVLGTSGKEIKSPYVSLSAQTVQVACQILKTKTVNIDPDFAPGLLTQDMIYELDSSSLKTVKVAGSADVLEKLEAIKTKKIRSVSEDGVQIGLELPPGIRCMDGDRLTLRFSPHPRQTRQMEVHDITGIGLREDLTCTIHTQSVPITFTGSENALNKLSAVNGTVDLQGLGPGIYSLPLQLPYLENVWVTQPYYIEVEIK